MIPPNASLVFDVELLENEGNIMNPATFVDANPLTPRTPDSITEAFDIRSRRKMLVRVCWVGLGRFCWEICWIYEKKPLGINFFRFFFVGGWE